MLYARPPVVLLQSDGKLCMGVPAGACLRCGHGKCAYMICKLVCAGSLPMHQQPGPPAAGGVGMTMGCKASAAA